MRWCRIRRDRPGLEQRGGVQHGAAHPVAVLGEVHLQVDAGEGVLLEQRFQPGGAEPVALVAGCPA